MNDEQRRAFDLILFHMRDYGDYHHRKEQMAYAVTVLYLGAAATLLLRADFWPSSAPGLFGFTVLALVTAVAAGAFVWWQLDRRRWAADLAGACVTVTTRWLTSPPDDAARAAVPIQPLSASSTERPLEMPRAVAEELAERINRRRGVWLPAFLTLFLMGIWALAILVRFLVRLSEVGLMDIKWLTAIGLGFDVVGVFGVGFFPIRFGLPTNPIVDWANRPCVLRLWVASWVAILLGFVFQLVAVVSSRRW